MPEINGLRILNTNFKKNRRRFDDFYIPLNSNNLLIEGENGDGKTLFIQACVQSIIPNSYFYKSNNISKLFLDNDNKIIYSMIGWNLDEGYEYKHLITGFCAKKVTIDEENKKPFQSFNFIILYNEESELSVDKIAFTKEDKNGTRYLNYDETRKYIEGLNDESGLCISKCYTNKREYLKLLFDYGISESEWNLILNINQQEGGAEDYFTKRYKHSKDFIMQEVIPIIEKIDSYRLDIKSDDSNLVTPLLSLNDTIKRISEKTLHIDELNLIENCVNKIVLINDKLREEYELLANTSIKTVEGYNKVIMDIDTLDSNIESLRKEQDEIDTDMSKYNDKIESLKIKISENNEAIEDYNNEIDKMNKIDDILKRRNEVKNIILEISSLREMIEICNKEIINHNDTISQYKSNIRDIEDEENRRLAGNVYLEYKQILNQIYKVEKIIEKYKGGYENELLKKNEIESKLRYALLNAIESIQRDMQLCEDNINNYKSKISNILSYYNDLSVQYDLNNKNIELLLKNIKDIENAEKPKIRQSIETTELDRDLNIKHIIKEIKTIEDLSDDVHFGELNMVSLPSDDLSKIEEMLYKGDDVYTVIDSWIKYFEDISNHIDVTINKLNNKKAEVVSDTRVDILEADRRAKYESINEKIKETDKKNNSINDLNIALAEVNMEIRTNRGSIDDFNRKLDKYNEDISNIESILIEYGGKDRWTVELEIEKEIEKTKNCLIELYSKKEDTIQLINDLKNNHLVKLSSDIEKSASFVVNKYPNAILGRDFIKNLNIEERDKFLTQSLLIPYSVLMNNKDFNSFVNDTDLQRKIGDVLFPIINIDRVKVKSPLDNDIVFFNTTDKDIYLNENEVLNKIKILENTVIDVELDIQKNNELYQIKEDKAVSLKNINICYDADFEERINNNILQHMKQIESLKLKQNNISEEINSISDDIIKIKNEIKDINDDIDKINLSIDDIKNDLKRELNNIESSLIHVTDAYKITIKNKETLHSTLIMIDKHNQYNDKISQCNKTILKIENDVCEYKKTICAFEDKNKNIESLKKVKEIEMEKNEELKDICLDEINAKKLKIRSYKEDLGKLTATDSICKTDKSIEFLKSEFDVINAEIDRNNIQISIQEEQLALNKNNLEEKQGILDSCTYNLDYHIKNDINIVRTDEKFLNKLNNKKSKLKEEVDEIKNKINEIEKGINRLEGTIEALEKNKNNIDTEEDVEIDEFFDYRQSILLLNKQIDIINSDIDSSNTMIREYEDKKDISYTKYKEKTEHILENETKKTTYNELKNKIEYLLDKYNIDRAITSNCTNSLDFIQKEAKNTLGKIYDEIKNAKNSHNNEIESTYSYLKDSVFGFVDILKNIEPPESIESLMSQNDKILSSEGYLYYLHQEKETIFEELESLNKIQEEYILTCVNTVEILIQKVYKLSSYSKVNIEGEQQNLIELKLHELSREDKMEKMTMYIKNILSSLDSEEFVEVEDKVKFLKTQLSPSLLFEQGIKSLNKCEVQIYVPDSIDSNGGELVTWGGGASSGQRNTMYITAAIALLIFSREMSSAKRNMNSKKVLFLDGPFRGAAATYLWENIFTLMNENNIQLIATNYKTPENLLKMFGNIQILKGNMIEYKGKPCILNTIYMKSHSTIKEKSLISSDLYS